MSFSLVPLVAQIHLPRSVFDSCCYLTVVVFRFSAKKGFRQLLLDCGHILSLYPFSPISITFTILLTTTTNYRNRANYNNHTNTTLTFITITTTSAIITTIDLTSLSPARYAVPGGVFPPTTLQLELYSSSVLEHSIHIDNETLCLQGTVFLRQRREEAWPPRALV